MKKRDDRGGAERMNGNDERWSLGARLALGGAVTLGALASGFLASRRGRRLVADTFKGMRRSPLADRVLDRFWDEPTLARRRLDVEEPKEGTIVLVGSIAVDGERELACEVAARVPWVVEVVDQLVLDPTLVRRRARSEKDLTRRR
jgi:hypothetical protein